MVPGRPDIHCDEAGETSYYGSGPALLLVAQDAGSLRDAGEAAVLAGARVVAKVGYQQACEPPLLARLDIVLIEATSAAPEVLDQVLACGQDLAVEHGARIIVCFGEVQIDQVVAQASGPGVQLLCNPSMIDRVAALAVAGRPEPLLFHDSSVQEGEAEQLRRLNDEVARIAETLARLARPGASNGNGRNPAITYAMDGHRPEHGREVSPDSTLPEAASVRAAIRARRLRGQFFDASLFADPAWDMLLDLFAARLERAAVSVSSLCIAAAVPPTTALRWIATMTEAGLFERQDDPLDRRRAYVTLSERAFEGMVGYAAALRRAGLRFC